MVKKQIRFKLIAVILIMALTAACGNTGGTSESGTSSGTSGGESSKSEQKSNFNKQGYPIVDEPITLELMGARNPIDGEWKELFLFETMRDMTNIQFEFNTPTTDAFKEKKNLAFASGDLPDVFLNGMLTPEDELSYGSQGILIPLEDLIKEHAPNLQKLFEEVPKVKASITAPDGHIYALPEVRTAPSHAKYGARLYPDVNAFEKSGIEELPTTTEELYTTLKTLKENGYIPLSAKSIAGLRRPMLAAFGHIMSVEGLRVKDGKVIYVPTQENYKAYLEYMYKLYTEGLLDQEIFSHTRQQYVAKGHKGKFGIFNTWSQQIVIDTTRPEIVEQQMPSIPLMTSPVNDEKIYHLSHEVTTGAFAITNQNKHPKATIRWADFFYSVRGTLLSTHGVLYDEEWIKSDKKYVDLSNVPEDYEGESYTREQLTPQVGPVYQGSGYYSKVQKNVGATYTTGLTEEEFGPYAQNPLPILKFTPEEQKKINILVTDIMTYTQQMEAKFIAGQESLDNWDNYVDTIKQMNVDELVSLYQASYDRWEKALQ